MICLVTASMQQSQDLNPGLLTPFLHSFHTVKTKQKNTRTLRITGKCREEGREEVLPTPNRIYFINRLGISYLFWLSLWV